jgi:hypothetical protein
MMSLKEFNITYTLTTWVKSLQANWRIYFSAQLRCSSLNRMTIPLCRALLDRKINAPLDLFNCGFQVEPEIFNVGEGK